MVFGMNDLSINFTDLKKSSSKLGQVYGVPSGCNEYALAGKEKGWEIEEIEVFSLITAR